jgi:APA family basic amino acid/polyamine antiporter
MANMIGTGVFTSLGFQVGDLPTGFPIILLWTLGGLLSLCGAFCYAELGAMMPRSGGEYHLLREGVHPLAGFLAGWISITVGFAAPVALAAAAFGEYLGRLSGDSDPRWFAIPVVVAVTVVHLGSLRFTGKFQVVFTAGKILLILILIAAAALAKQSFSPSLAPVAGDSERILQPAFAISLVYVMYAYTGWNAAAYIVGEIREPQRNLPRALIIGTLLVTVLYVALNVAFLIAAPAAELEGQPEVALIAAQHLFGERGGALMGLLIAFGLISSISAMTWAGPRVAQTMGEDHRLFRLLSKRNRHQIPARAILLQGAIVTALVATTTFKQLLLYIESLLILSSMVTVAAVFWLRFKRPDAERPFRVPLYPLTPILYIAASLWMLWFLTARHPVESAWGLATLVLGWLVYLGSKWKSQPKPKLKKPHDGVSNSS